jgi:hypothetical protein
MLRAAVPLLTFRCVTHLYACPAAQQRGVITLGRNDVSDAQWFNTQYSMLNFQFAAPLIIEH